MKSNKPTYPAKIQTRIGRSTISRSFAPVYTLSQKQVLWPTVGGWQLLSHRWGFREHSGVALPKPPQSWDGSQQAQSVPHIFCLNPMWHLLYFTSFETVNPTLTIKRLLSVLLAVCSLHSWRCVGQEPCWRQEVVSTDHLTITQPSLKLHTTQGHLLVSVMS